jgi:hypothetical protein
MRIVLGLALDARQRAVLLESVGGTAGEGTRPGQVMSELVEIARLSPEAGDLLGRILVDTLAAELAAHRASPVATLAERWLQHALLPRRQLAALLLDVATRSGAIERVMEERFVEDVEVLVYAGPRRLISGREHREVVKQ